MRPILIGTITVEKSENLGRLLTNNNIKCQILNAKPENANKEAEIIARAGEKGRITIATNMAGRGTDIILGGNVKFNTHKKLYKTLVFHKKFLSISMRNSTLSLFQKLKFSNLEPL